MSPQINADKRRWQAGAISAMPKDPRNHLRLSAFICGPLLLLSSFATPAQTLYKCVQANGRVQYQQEPCVDAKKQSTVRAPDPVAAKSEAELKAAGDKAAKAAEMNMSQIGQVIADASLCTSDVPGWDAKHGTAFQAWKVRNGEMVTKFNDDADARARAIARMDSERARFAADKNRNALATSCEALASRLAAPAAAPKK
ncbi:MAG TPA: DUF4124 domain-containing protein [Burkholderiales bacterium]|nr:DUF4124 domain-containing protein [Burkholderiales bacterium]